MMSLFEGYHGAHGRHGKMSANASKGGKQEIKKSAVTVREPVTEALWNSHLRGESPLGIIPIMEDGNCLWGCIDIDQYDIDLGAIAAEISRRGLPLVVCRTKSGGAHVFMFLRRPSPAEDLIAKLRQIAASMGWGDSEVFPKQKQILSERGDLGNWLNMPYLDAENTSRYGIKPGGSGMTITEFLNYAELKKTDLDTVSEMPAPADETLEDGPPCLQHLSVVGFAEGTRNNGLFGLGIFCKKKFGTRWKEMLEKYNRDFMNPPLSSDEVQKTIQSLEKKDYQYKCKDAPCVSYCNVALCKTRKFGVGGAGKYPTISGMSKLDAGEDSLWFLDIEDERIELTTDQLQNYREFQRICMNQLTVLYLPMKAETWASMVGEAMANATIIQPAPEMTTIGHFMELLEEFVTNRYRGQSRDDILLGKSWLSESEGRHYFRLGDFVSHLEKSNFRVWGRNKVGQRLEEIGGRQFFNIKGKGVNSYWVPDNFSGVPSVDLPESSDDPV